MVLFLAHNINFGYLKNGILIYLDPECNHSFEGHDIKRFGDVMEAWWTIFDIRSRRKRRTKQ